MARLDSGTQWAEPTLCRFAGTSQVAWRALRAVGVDLLPARPAPERAAVGTRNSSASLVAAQARERLAASRQPATSAYGSALRCWPFFWARGGRLQGGGAAGAQALCDAPSDHGRRPEDELSRNFGCFLPRSQNGLTYLSTGHFGERRPEAGKT